MKKNILPLLLVITLGIGMMAGCSAAAPASAVTISSEPAASVVVSTSGNQSENGYGAAGALSDTDLTTEEMLVYAMQDEHLAHGEYVHILTIFGNQNPFTNIIKAEEKHIADLGVLFGKYNVPVPEDASASHLIVPESVKMALETGVQAEISNIAMYAHFLEQSLPADVKDVFTLLLKGSESHLAAFQKNLGK
jgi:hypothetical protein